MASSTPTPKSVMFVCLGNINRSAVAHWVLKAAAKERGIPVNIASAGTSGYHVGEGADANMVKAAAAAGYDLSEHKSAQVTKAAGAEYDLVIAMDSSNMEDLKALLPSAHHSKLRMFCSYCPEEGVTDVPDPYYEGGHAGVVALVEKGVAGLLDSDLKP